MITILAKILNVLGLRKMSYEEFDKRIVAECPILYKDRYVDMSKTAMCWGFDIGQGWYDLVYKLSKDIESINKTLPENQRCIATQVKSKYAGLRFYHYGGTKEIRSLIDEASNKSYKICEDCGDKGKGVTINGWHYTLCKRCAKTIEERR